MKLIYSIFFLNFISFAVCIPEIKHFFIEENRERCALIDISADITVSYNTTKGMATTVMNFINSSNDQTGRCSSSDSKYVQFNISIPPQETLSLRFANLNNFIYLLNATFVYNPSDTNFPNSIETGTSVAVYNETIYLSNIKNNFQCNSTLELNMIKGVTLKIYFIKAKVYQVHNTFSNDSDICPQDYSNYTTIQSSSSTLTSHTIIPSTKTSMKSTETTVTKHTETTSTKNTETTSTKNTETTPTKNTETTSTKNTETTPTKNTETTSTKNTETTSTKNTETTPTKNTETTPTKNTEATTRSSQETTSKSVTTAIVPSTSHKSSSSTTTPPQPGPPDDWTFAVQDKGTICLLLYCHINIDIDEKSIKENSINNLSNKNTTSEGYCSDTEDRIVIKYNNTLSLQIDFQKSGSSFNLHQVSLNYKNSNSHFNISRTYNNDYEAPLNNVYTCDDVILKISNSKINLSNLKFEAFRNTKNYIFSSTETSCNPSKSPIVAIIVGVVLAVFLIIVIIIFLIMRYRAHKLKGYQEI